jgi:hypothetical protein
LCVGGGGGIFSLLSISNYYFLDIFVFLQVKVSFKCHIIYIYI